MPNKSYNIYSYLLFYFLVFYLAILFVDFFHNSIFIFSSTLSRSIFIAIVLYLCFISMNFYKTGHFKLYYGLLELFPLMPIILYFKGKFFSNNKDNVGFYYGFSIFLFIIFFSVMFFTSLIFLIYKPLYLSLTETSNNYLIFLKPVGNIKTVSFFIIIHNMAFLSLIFLGSPFLFLPTFANLYFMSIITIPVIVGSMLDGYFNYVLPNGILEISGTVIGSAASFILFMFIVESVKLKDNFTGARMYMKFIASGLLMSIFSFIFAWPIETKLIYMKHVSIEWLKVAYFIDFYMLAVDAIIIFKLLKNHFISALEYFSLYFFISLFLFGFIVFGFFTIDIISLGSIYMIVYGAFSIYFLLNSIFTSFHRKLNWFKINGNEFALIGVRGISMNPEFKAGDSVIIKRIKTWHELKVGDIITYKSSNINSPLNASGYITHRIHEISGDIIRTKGDNNKVADYMKIRLDDIVGIAVAKVVYINRRATGIEMIGDNSNKEDLPFFTPFNIRARKSSLYFNIYFIAISLILIMVIL